jgi:predicted methyltransferase MtxX (methanogen marker protein 4)
MLRRVAFIRTDVSEELIVSIISVTRIGELGKKMAVAGTEAHCERILTIQVRHGMASQKTAFFIVTAVIASNLTRMHSRKL